jgi:hypothetical protein
VNGNLFASTIDGPFPSIVAIEALDSDGHAVAIEHVPGR